MMRKVRHSLVSRCLGTSMGFAPEGELEAAGVCGIVHSIEEMMEYILAR